MSEIESFEERQPDTIRCRYCGKYHECNADGVVEGMCRAERLAKQPFVRCTPAERPFIVQRFGARGHHPGHGNQS